MRLLSPKGRSDANSSSPSSCTSFHPLITDEIQGHHTSDLSSCRLPFLSLLTSLEVFLVVSLVPLNSANRTRGSRITAAFSLIQLRKHGSNADKLLGELSNLTGFYILRLRGTVFEGL